MEKLFDKADFLIKPIGWVKSCYTQKFGIPRQPGLVTSSKGEIHFYEPYCNPEAFAGIQHCSHIWIEFYFHEQKNEAFKPRVKAPRLGGNKTLGVFACRSPNRPNRIGLSAVKLDEIQVQAGKLILCVSGLDILNNSPVLDVKPYIPYADKINDATNTFASSAPSLIEVRFSEAAETFCFSYQRDTGNPLKQLVEQVLSQDPRPAFQKQLRDREYGITLFDVNIRWKLETQGDDAYFYVLSCEQASDTPSR